MSRSNVVEVTPRRDEAEQPQSKYDRPVDDISEKAIVEIYKDLSRTQQRVVTYICEMPVAQLPVDDFLTAFSGKYGSDWVKGEPEMYYRLRTLHFQGLCQLRKVGPGASVVIRNSKVSHCLREHDLLVS